MCNLFAELVHFFALRNKNQIAMSKVKFYPWIGKNWGVSFGGKLILVLGESHYCASPADAYPGMTWDIIKDLFDPNSPHEPYKNTYTKFAKALSGKFDRMTIADKEELWESVAFYNYIQEPLTGPRIAPSDAQFKASEEAFEEVVDTWQPDVIIAWGHRLYSHLPGWGYQGRNVQGPDGTQFETWVYPLPDGRCAHVLGIDHPSVGFTPEYWHFVIKQLIE